MMKIVVDVGGTKVRVAVADGAEISQFRRYRTDDYTKFEDILADYLDQEGLTGAAGKLYLGVAGGAMEIGGVPCWRFSTGHIWHSDLENFEYEGWTVGACLNDFEAAAWALADPDLLNTQALRAGEIQEEQARCLLGPGTGLGVAYLLPLGGKGEWHVQSNPFGVNGMAVAVTEEQRQILRIVTEKITLKNGTLPSFETVASGRGMPILYEAVCIMNERAVVHQNAADIFTGDDEDALQAIRLFHEFLGLAAHTVLAAVHVTGGLYLTGGVLDRLVNNGRFDKESFLKFMALDVRERLRKTFEDMPVFLVKNKRLELRGLARRALLKEQAQGGGV